MTNSISASTSFGALLAGLGVSGLWFTLPAGIVADKFGPAITAFIGGIILCGGYLSFSFASNKGLLVVSYLFVGVGSGSTFLSALRTSISLGRTVGISMVSVAMSLSITLTVQVKTLLSNAVCDDTKHADCWRQFCRYYAVIIAIIVAIGGACMWDAHKYVPRLSETRARASSLTEQLTLLQSFRILKKPYFWCLWTANLVGLGSGVFIVNSIFGDTGLWNDYLRDSEFPLTESDIVLIFSMLCACTPRRLPRPFSTMILVLICRSWQCDGPDRVQFPAHPRHFARVSSAWDLAGHTSEWAATRHFASSCWIIRALLYVGVRPECVLCAVGGDGCVVWEHTPSRWPVW